MILFRNKKPDGFVSLPLKQRRKSKVAVDLVDLSRYDGHLTMWSKLGKIGVTAVMLAVFLAGCATGSYTLLSDAEKDEIAQLKENVYRAEYRTSPFTSQQQLDLYLRRRCAELTLREGYDFFHLAQRTDVLGFSRRTAMTVTLYKGQKPIGTVDFYDAKKVLTEASSVLPSN